jgi:antitoxin component YwqK of YwqJK toxin-antitoxin module
MKNYQTMNNDIKIKSLQFSTSIKFLLVLTLFITFCNFSFAQSDSINKVDSKGLKHGVWKKVENQNLVYEGQFIHGNPFGKFTYYYEDGKTVKSVSNFSSNGKIAYVTSYHSNGKVSSYGKYIDKIKDSSWVYFGDNELKIAEEQYSKGKKNGVWKQYDYQTGSILEETSWKNDLKNGATKAYMLNGNLRYQIMYKDDKANGPYFVNYASGTVLEKGVYKNSLKDSITTNFDETGKIIRKRKWDKGYTTWDKFWIWNDAGKKEVDVDSISYLFRDIRTFTIVCKKGERIKGNGEWTNYVDFLSDKGFINYTPKIFGSIYAPRRLEEIEEGVYKVIFKQDLGYDVVMKDSELGFLKSIRPKLFKKK